MKRLLYLCLGMIIGAAAGLMTADHAPRPLCDTIHTLYIDTITYRVPVEVESVVVRTEVAILPLYYHPHTLRLTDTVLQTDTVTVRDSAAVLIPITQHHYTAPDYNAWVSGYHARLDSITVYPRHETITLRTPPRRWHIGLSAGYGITPRGAPPYLGLSLTYSILSF